MGRGPLPHACRRRADSRPRHVRALVPHRFWCQGRQLCRRVYERYQMGQCRHALCASGCRQHRNDDQNTEEVMTRATMLIFALGFVLAPVSVAGAQEIDWKKVDSALGKSAAVSGDVHRYGFPRSDLQVTLDGVAIKPAFALGSWVAFKPMHGGAMIMGDLVLLETEVNPVMAKLLESGLEVTAVHNHLLRASPATFYMHVGGHGDPAKMAAVIRDALGVSKTPLTAPTAAAPPPAIDLDTAQLDQLSGAKGQANGGVTQC